MTRPDPTHLSFVILRHETNRLGDNAANVAPIGSAVYGPVHFDWMFQVGETLKTWSTSPVDDLAAELVLDATQLPDHRLAYLQIEGDIGGGRGSVSRMAQGILKTQTLGDDHFAAYLHWHEASAPSPARKIKIQRIARESWRLRLERGLYDTKR